MEYQLLSSIAGISSFKNSMISGHGTSPLKPIRQGSRFLALSALMVLAGCAGQMITYDQKLLMEADSLFKMGNYEYAKIRYTKLHTDYPNTKFGAKAQYNLGFINIYYDNPFANWEAALREFKTFAAQYPSHELIPEVNSWIRLLVVLQSFKRQYDVSSAEVGSLENELKNRQNQPTQRKIEPRYEVLMEAVQKCYIDKDSLSTRIRVLEEVIDKIGKNP
jgi:hypothetical protein